MRVLWVLLAACAGPGSASAPPAEPAPRAVSPAAAPTAPPTHVRARVGLENGSWTDIAVEGADDKAVFMCKKLVDHELGPLRVPNVRVLRACSVDPLPPTPRTTVQLVSFEAVTFESAVFALAPTDQTLFDDKAFPRATVRRVTPLEDRVACEAMLVRLEAEDERARIESQQAVARFLDGELQRTIADQEATCNRAKETAQRCANNAKREQLDCQLRVEHERRECDSYTQRREVLEQRRAKPLEPERTVQRTCRVP